MISTCPICRSKEWDAAYEAEAPVHWLVEDGFEISDDDFHSLEVVRCQRCGHLFNRAFEAALADRMYGDAPLSNVPIDPTMFARLHDLVAWIGEDALTDADVVEIGGGGGHMARLLAEHAKAVTIFEPCLDLTPEMLPDKNITLVSATFPQPDVASKCDFLLCRQVLEHLENPRAIMTDIQAFLRDGGTAYLEVPDLRYILDNAAFTDLHLQHVHGFSRDNFIALAAEVGLKALRVLDIKAGHDFGVLFEKAPPASKSKDFSPIPSPNLKRRLRDRVELVGRILAPYSGRIAIYGATINGQAFLNALAPNIRFLRAFDDNEDHHGRLMYNRVQTLPVGPASPEALVGCEAIVIAAYLHDKVIALKLRALGFRGRIFSARGGPAPSGDVQVEILS